MSGHTRTWPELDEIITHEFPLAEYKAGFETMMSGEGIKVVLGIG